MDKTRNNNYGGSRHPARIEASVEQLRELYAYQPLTGEIVGTGKGIEGLVNPKIAARGAGIDVCRKYGTAHATVYFGGRQYNALRVIYKILLGVDPIDTQCAVVYRDRCVHNTRLENIDVLHMPSGAVEPLASLLARKATVPCAGGGASCGGNAESAQRAMQQLVTPIDLAETLPPVNAHVALHLDFIRTTRGRTFQGRVVDGMVTASTQEFEFLGQKYVLITTLQRVTKIDDDTGAE